MLHIYVHVKLKFASSVCSCRVQHTWPCVDSFPGHVGGEKVAWERGWTVYGCHGTGTSGKLVSHL